MSSDKPFIVKNVLFNLFLFICINRLTIIHKIHYFNHDLSMTSLLSTNNSEESEENNPSN